MDANGGFCFSGYRQETVVQEASTSYVIPVRTLSIRFRFCGTRCFASIVVYQRAKKQNVVTMETIGTSDAC